MTGGQARWLDLRIKRKEKEVRYTVVCVGKLKEKFWVAACAEYVKRLGAYAKVEVREVADVDPARAWRRRRRQAP